MRGRIPAEIRKISNKRIDDGARETGENWSVDEAL
jgi:hypothetical protein